MLLTSNFSTPSLEKAKPLTVAEWARFAKFMKFKSRTPGDLLENEYSSLFEGFNDKSITFERIDSLMKRGTAMAFALEKWSRADIWVISRADEEYPNKLKNKLGHNSPPVLYGCGNKALLNSECIGVVGSRAVSEQDLTFTRSLGERISRKGLSLVSGGAKGVDQAAMLAALDAEGTVLGVLADSLLSTCCSQKYNQHLANNNLLLISPFFPEARFNVGLAMQRNKYIYCFSDATVVIHSGNPEFSKNSRGGGTWSGAIENLKKTWVPLWVKRTDDKKAGNALIVKQGGQWLPSDIDKIKIENLAASSMIKPQAISGNILSEAKEEKEIEEQDNVVNFQLAFEKEKTKKTNHKTTERFDQNDYKEPENISYENFYQYFLVKIKPFLNEAKSIDELSELLDIHKSQLNIWLKQSVDENIIEKLNRPIRYRWSKAQDQQKLF